MKLYGLKACDTCRKAIKALSENGIEVTFHDVRADPLGADKIAQFLAAFGADTLVNTRSTTWRSLDEIARAASPNALLEAHPALMKRPIIETDDGTLFLGWKADVKTALGV